MQFRDAFAFLSNFAVVPGGITIRARPESGLLVAPTVEHAFQACKTRDEGERRAILLAVTPAIAKSMGRKVALRDDWNAVRIPIMRALLKQKFGPFAKQLLFVKEEIVEDNTWGDVFWGRCRGKGENWLGRLLMERREELLL